MKICSILITNNVKADAKCMRLAYTLSNRLDKNVWCFPENLSSLEVLKNPRHPEYRETKVWVGLIFNPTKFSVDACNKELRKLNKYMKAYEEGF